MLCNLAKSDPVSAYRCAEREARKKEAQERLRLYEETGDIEKVEAEMQKREMSPRSMGSLGVNLFRLPEHRSRVRKPHPVDKYPVQRNGERWNTASPPPVEQTHVSPG